MASLLNTIIYIININKYSKKKKKIYIYIYIYIKFNLVNNNFPN